MATEQNKKLRAEIIAVVVVAVIIVTVAALFVTQYVMKSREEQKIAEMINEEMGRQLDENSQKAEELRKQLNQDLVGTYLSQGDVVAGEDKISYLQMTLLSDGKVSAVKASDGSSVDGWWMSSKRGEVELVSMGFDGGKSIEVYQVYNSYLIDASTVYFGHVEKSPAFESTLVMSNEKGSMTMELKNDGKASAEFLDTNEDSENYGVKYMFGGSYNVEGDLLTVTLNSATTRFLMFDYNISEADTDSGIASIYYQKQV